MRRVERLGACDHVVFGGRLPAEPHGIAARAMVEGTAVKDRDRRDWAAIRAWADDIAAALGVPAG
jgi:menaquinone-dependent protoporphyrinogen oxidase